MHEQIVLNSLSMDDLSDIFAIHSDSSLQSLRMAHRSSVSRSQVEKWLSAKIAASDESVYLAVRDPLSGRCLGYVCLTNLDWISGTAEVGIVLIASGRGFGTAALLNLMELAANQFGFRRLTARILDHNFGAQRLFRKVGFSLEGTQVRHYLADDVYHDVLLFGYEFVDFSQPAP